MNRSYAVLLLILALSLQAAAQKGYVKRADRLMSSFRFAEAAELYQKEIASDTNDLASMAKLGNTYALMSDYKKAEAIYKTLTAEPLSLPVNWFYYAQLLRRNGKYAAADTAYQMFARALPEDSRAIEFNHFADKLKPLLADSNFYAVETLSINTDASEIAPNYFQQHFVFASNRDTGSVIQLTDAWTGRGFYEMYEQDSTAPVVKMKGKLNEIYNEGSVAFSANGREMIFSRNNEGKIGTDGIRKLGLFHADFDSVKKEWSNIQPLTFNSTTYDVTHPALSKDGNTLYFISDMPGGFGETDIYKSTKANNVWSAPVNLGMAINTQGSEMFPFLANDSLLYFSTDTRIGFGGLDIYPAALIKGEWQNVKNAGIGLNSMADDFGYISDAADKRGFFVSDRTGGKGSDDIYRFVKKDVVLRLMVTDAKTNTPMDNAIITIISNKQEDRIIRTDSKGEFTFTLEAGSEYHIEINKDGYYTYRDSMTTGNFSAKNISLNPISATEIARNLDSTNRLVDSLKAIHFQKLFNAATGKGFKPAQSLTEDSNITYYQNNVVFELPKVYFDLNSWKINPLSEAELDNVAEVMNNFPELVVEISAHTDSRGSAESNLVLSSKRADACVTYLLSKGIAKERLSAIGYGEGLIRNKCKDGVTCTEAEHAINRRTEFKVVKFD